MMLAIFFTPIFEKCLGVHFQKKLVTGRGCLFWSREHLRSSRLQEQNTVVKTVSSLDEPKWFHFPLPFLKHHFPFPCIRILQTTAVVRKDFFYYYIINDIQTNTQDTNINIKYKTKKSYLLW